MQSHQLSSIQSHPEIERAYREVVDAYLASHHRKKVELIDRAFQFACRAHEGALRRSGEPYIMHPVAVARIVIKELGLGSTSICAALLHDVVNAGDYTVEDIRSAFGDKIASIVEGVTKISGGILGMNAESQAENFRKLLLSMSTDVRVVLVKMADRLHNMRTLGSLRPEKQLKIAGETLYVYAPLAHRLGLYKMKEEFEDLSFRYEHPDKYAEIKSLVDSSATERNALVEKFVAPIRKKLDAAGYKYTVKARVKTAYSIWRKMQKKKVEFADIYDVYALRVVFENENDADEAIRCWQIYTFFTEDNRVHPDRLRDWITTPKSNGYRALHTTVMGPDGNWIEVQIRSAKMDRIAELGYAAHWKYKHNDYEEDSELSVWMNTIKDILANPEPDAVDFLDTIKLNLFASAIYVFTPKGELRTLPKGSTVLDLAFAIHTELGLHCIAGKIAHRLVPISHPLESGDQVEIITSDSQQPRPEWLGFCHTSKAKQALRPYCRQSGEKENKPLPPKDSKSISSSILSKILRNPFSSRKKAGEDPSPYILRGGHRPNYHTEACCSPLPVDAVVGFRREDGSVVLHKADCPRAALLRAESPDSVIDVHWENTDLPVSLEVLINASLTPTLVSGVVSLICNEPQIRLRRLLIDGPDSQATITLTLDNVSSEAIEPIRSAISVLSGVQSVNIHSL